LNENERMVSLTIKDRVRVEHKVRDPFEGLRWVEKEIAALHLDPATVDFGYERVFLEVVAWGESGSHGEAWLEGSVGERPD
jgi:hypothetical protein